MELDLLSNPTIGGAVEGHRSPGPGLPGNVCEQAPVCELAAAGAQGKIQSAVPFHSKAAKLDCGSRLDLPADDLVVVERKSVESLLPVHGAQLLTWLQPAGKKAALLFNFNVPLRTQGLKRRARPAFVNFVPLVVTNKIPARL